MAGGTRGSLSVLGRLHDRLTEASFAVAGAALVMFTAVMAADVAFRYLFSAPILWAQDAVAISLCASIFLALPYITMTARHSSINTLTDSLGQAAKRRIHVFSLVVSAIVLGVVSWIAVNETTRQFAAHIQTASSFAIPKWPVSTLITYGLVSSALHVLRNLFGRNT
jgi:TRAP-type C4-dicarboxylate transport system permease small subunit